jgi:NTE family protein
MTEVKPNPTGVKPVNLALQGGGAHGAFTWGVLDALLETGSLRFDSISGTSAGAMNAVVLASGYMEGGADGAREALRAFWRAVSQKAAWSPLKRTPFDWWAGNWSLENSPAFQAYQLMAQVWSPYDFNPLDYNPLRDVVEEMVDFERVKACEAFSLFVSATNVLTGKARVFSGADITLDAVMASACLPTLYKAVEIDGVPYWDGGYGGNPALYPFFYESDVEDCILVQINPVERTETPKTAQEIQDRVNEITFNGALLREFRAIEFVRRLKVSGRLDGTQYSTIRMHRIEANEAISDLSASSKLNTEMAFLDYLHDLGRAAALDFVDNHYEAIGKRATLDLTSELRADILPDPKKGTMGARLRAVMKNRKTE